MILVVGHGPSSEVDPDWVDAQDFVVRLFTGTNKSMLAPGRNCGVFRPDVGTKTDAVCTTRPHHSFSSAEVWYEARYRKTLREMADPFTSKKLSSGANGCLIARIKFPDEDIGVIGFDTTMRLIRLDMWPYHDAIGEGKLLREIGVKDYGNYGEDV